jgi:H+/Cl- antiporter ClcA
VTREDSTHVGRLINETIDKRREMKKECEAKVFWCSAGGAMSAVFESPIR